MTGLQQHIRKFITINDSDLAGISSFFEPLSLKKKENLLVESNVCKSNYFVEKGLLRMFFINDKGMEQTTHFALENWWIADYTSFESQIPATFNIQAVEKTEALALTYIAQEEMLQQYPVMERYFKLMHQRVNAVTQFRIRYLYDKSSEEMYHHFNKSHPDFVQRVPQYLLASFLGFSPEYLSEIRAKRKS
jgi:CRP-like cAMP-binding protein